ncbi:MAG TPA: hypothetical protein VN428_14535 [Bryobacteraceae bacterium]|nr:hypothetical protein [Bryobacteraceae bacterium]
MRVLGLLAILASLGAAAELRVGAASNRITPPQGTPMSGYYHVRLATGVHDDLYARAIVIESAGTRAALVSCDMIGVPADIVSDARSRIERVSGIPVANVMISATHAHTGPDLKNAPEYAAALPEKIAEAVSRAAAALVPAQVSAATGSEPSLVFNRRFVMTDGSTGWNPGKLNPKIVRPAGPVDPAVAVVSFDRATGERLATYVNYALHLDTVGGQEFSADYPATLGRLLAAVQPGQPLTVFTIGTAGQVNHIDVKSGRPQGGHSEAERIGTVLAGEVLKTYTRLAPVSPAPLRATREAVPLALAPIRQEDVPWARETWAKFGKPGAAPFLDLVRAGKILDVAKREGKPIDAEVQVITLGRELAFVGLPGEIFVELGMAIKKASPYPNTIVVELANGSIGYVPDRKAYAEGNYEPVSTRIAEGSGERLVEAAVRMLRAARSE